VNDRDRAIMEDWRSHAERSAESCEERAARAAKRGDLEGARREAEAADEWHKKARWLRGQLKRDNNTTLGG
jgi:hypothetical protein